MGGVEGTTLLLVLSPPSQTFTPALRPCLCPAMGLVLPCLEKPFEAPEDTHRSLPEQEEGGVLKLQRHSLFGAFIR